MIKIGLTGNIASGKSEVRKIIENYGIPTICSDSIVHDLLENNKNVKSKIIELFGNENILTNDDLDRKKIGKIVFSDKNKKDKLEKIIHPQVLEKIDEFFNENKNKKSVVVDMPLLYEGSFEHFFDKIILVYADDKIRFERIKIRNGFEDIQIKKIMDSQLSQEIKKEKSNFVIMNNSNSLENLNKEVEKIIKELI